MKEQVTITHGSNNSTGSLTNNAALIFSVIAFAAGAAGAYWFFYPSLKADIENKKNENEALKNQLKMLEGEKESIADASQKTIASLKNENQALKKEQTENIEVYKKLQAQHNILATERERILKDYEEHQKLWSELEKLYEETKKNNGELKREIIFLKSTIDLLRKQIEQKIQDIETLRNEKQKENEYFREINSQLREEISTLKIIHNKLNSELSQYQQENTRRTLQANTAFINATLGDYPKLVCAPTVPSTPLTPTILLSKELYELLTKEKAEIILTSLQIHNKSTTSKEDKCLLKCRIFKMLVHGNDQTIKQLLIEEKNKISNFSDKFNPDIREGIYTQYQNMDDKISNIPWSAQQLETIRKMFATGGIYSPDKDGTAQNYVAELLNKMRVANYVSPAEAVTEKAYDENFVKKIAGQHSRSNSFSS